MIWFQDIKIKVTHFSPIVDAQWKKLACIAILPNTPILDLKARHKKSLQQMLPIAVLAI